MTFDPLPYPILPAILHWLVVCGSLLGIVLAVALFASVLGNGLSGPKMVFRQLRDALIDTTHLSFRRVRALTQLTFRESVRRKTLLVFVVFGILFMFAGWFLSGVHDRPDMQVKVYVSFVLTVISWLILPIVLLLSCWGVPADIKARSLHTVVTKPARRNEIVLGRMLGFTIIGSLVLGIMGAVGYFWILRQVPNNEALVSRVPIYGALQFYGREGEPAEKGINVGDPWEFRGYIEGATQGRAVWTFEGVTPSALNENGELMLESSFEAFRTHKGTIGQSLLCQMSFINEDKGLSVQPFRPFEVSEFHEVVNTVGRKVTYTDDAGVPKEVDLFDDLVQDGRLQVEVRAVDPGQYLGMARPDLFIRTPDRPFFVGFAKAVFGIWLMMVLIIVLGVSASTILKGPVATLLTFTLIIVGQGFRGTLEQLVSDQAQGGGPFEASYRMYMHLNPQVPLDAGWGFDLLKGADAIVINLLWLAQHVIPDFGNYRVIPLVANGFDVDWSSALLPAVATTVAYLIPCLLIGYFCLKLRELEAK